MNSGAILCWMMSWLGKSWTLGPSASSPFDKGRFDSRCALFCLVFAHFGFSAFDVLTQDPSRKVREGLRSIPNPLKTAEKTCTLETNILGIGIAYYCLLLPLLPSTALWEDVGVQSTNVELFARLCDAALHDDTPLQYGLMHWHVIQE